ncbi:MAG: hypothetical protein ACYSUN_13780 [Planctomycetota bacterium]|jgi:hypothetical protein
MSKRTRLWTSDRHSEYWASKEEAERRANAHKYGEYTAADLDSIWPALGEDERALLEYLLLSGRRSVVALYEDPLCNALVDAKLLQIPPGVGTLLMQNLETTFKIPRAVWEEMNLRKAELVSVDASGPALDGRLRELSEKIGAHIRG